MSKYIKLDDAINAIENKIADYIPTLYGRYGEIPLELRMTITSLPTIEVSGNTAIRIVENECFREDLSQEIQDYLFSDLRHKLYSEQAEVSEDCISKEFISESLIHRITELNAQGEKALPISTELIKFKKFVDGITPPHTKRGEDERIEE